MSHVRFVCLHVTDATIYAGYRERMTPILADHGGHFLLDVQGGDVRTHPADFDTNWVLMLSFPSAAAADGFFSDPAYVAVRDAWFDRSVSHAHVQTFVAP